MKKIIIFCVSMAILFTVPVFAEPQSFDWKALENNYYTGTSPFMLNGKTMAQSEIKNANSGVDYSAVVEQYELKYNMLSLEGEKEKEAFLNDFKGGRSLRSMSEGTGNYFAPYKSEEGIGTAIVDKDGTFGQAFLGDEGKSYKLNLTSELKEGLINSSLKAAQTEAYYLIITDVCGGILFTDNSKEYYYVLDSAFESIKKDNLYTAQNLVDAIEKDKTITTREKLPITYTEEGLAIPETGGGISSAPEAQHSITSAIILACIILFVMAGITLLFIHKRTARRR